MTDLRRSIYGNFKKMVGTPRFDLLVKNSSNLLQYIQMILLLLSSFFVHIYQSSGQDSPKNSWRQTEKLPIDTTTTITSEAFSTTFSRSTFRIMIQKKRDNLCTEYCFCVHSHKKPPIDLVRNCNQELEESILWWSSWKWSINLNFVDTVQSVLTKTLGIYAIVDLCQYGSTRRLLVI